MFNKTFISLVMMTFGLNAYASTSVPVSGSVESKCVVTQDVIGVYGNPLPGVLSTDPADGGVRPVGGDRLHDLARRVTIPRKSLILILSLRVPHYLTLYTGRGLLR